MQDDAVLLSGLRQRDADAFTVFFTAYADPIYRLALGMLNDAAEAEEIVQTTILAVYEEIDRYEPRAKLSTWVYRIAHNQILMALRRRHPTVTLPDDTDALDPPDALADWHLSPEDELLSAEAQFMVRAAIAALPEHLRMAFVLRDVEAVSTRECAQIQGISETACKVRLHRARLVLRERLSRYFSERRPLVREESR